MMRNSHYYILYIQLHILFIIIVLFFKLCFYYCYVVRQMVRVSNTSGTINTNALKMQENVTVNRPRMIYIHTLWGTFPLKLLHKSVETCCAVFTSNCWVRIWRVKKKKKKTFQIVPSLDRRDVDVDEADMKVGLFHGQAAGLSRPWMAMHLL